MKTQKTTDQIIWSHNTKYWQANNNTKIFKSVQISVAVQQNNFDTWFKISIVADQIGLLVMLTKSVVLLQDIWSK